MAERGASVQRSHRRVRAIILMTAMLFVLSGIITLATSTWVILSLNREQAAAIATRDALLFRLFTAKVEFDRQANAWSSILTTSNDPQAYYDHLSQFYVHERAGFEALQAIARLPNLDATLRERIEVLLSHRRQSGLQYREAIHAFNDSATDAARIAGEMTAAVRADSDESFESLLDDVSRWTEEVELDFRNQALTAQIRALVMLIVVAAIILVALVSLLRSRLERPIAAAITAADTIASGDLEAPIQHAHSDEIGELFDALDAMRRRLATSAIDIRESHAALNRVNAELESRVELRTRALRESESRIRSILESIAIGAIVISNDGEIEVFNHAAEEIFGYDSEDVIGQKVNLLMPEPDAAVHDQYLEHFHRTGEARVIGHAREVTGRRKNGELFPMRLGVGHIHGSRHGFVGTVTDLTELRELEMRLSQSQRMEAVGQLTGGVAHDFNNVMMAIQGHADLLAMDLEAQPAQRRHIDAIVGAVQRGASLTQRLLAFSRRQTLQPEVIDAAALADGLSDMLGRTLGETVALEVCASNDLWPCFADRAQFENALVNLAINARDAMPEGGTITVAVGNCTLDADAAASLGDIRPGDYVVTTVSDTGKGMTPETLQRVFEPFFTTKAVGKGTGLGLSMVYGFARQSGGLVSIRSTPDQGTEVSVHLPRAEARAVPPDTRTDEGATARQPARILVVEDDDDVRNVPVHFLRQHGHEVLEAAEGSEALDVLARHGPFDLLFTDIVLPGALNGFQLAERADEVQPGIEILFTSGYAESALAPATLLERNLLLRKPYGRRALLNAVHRLVHRDGTTARTAGDGAPGEGPG